MYDQHQACAGAGFQRLRIGNLLITAFYDGFVPVPADDLRDS
jgi:hypothetical protein